MGWLVKSLQVFVVATSTILHNEKHQSQFWNDILLRHCAKDLNTPVNGQTMHRNNPHNPHYRTFKLVSSLQLLPTRRESQQRPANTRHQHGTRANATREGHVPNSCSCKAMSQVYVICRTRVFSVLAQGAEGCRSRLMICISTQCYRSLLERLAETTKCNVRMCAVSSARGPRNNSTIKYT